MTNTGNNAPFPISRERRSRTYFRLMDLCFVASLLVLASFLPVFEKVVGPNGTVPPWYQVYGAVLMFFVFFVTPFLVLARFMRDEYAERLFRRTTILLVYIAVAVPFLIFSAATLVYLSTLTPEAPWPFDLFMAQTTWWAALAEPFKIFCILFVLIFQFLRWKDSR